MISFVLAGSDHGAMIVNRLDFNEGFQGAIYGVGAQIFMNRVYDPYELDTSKGLLELRRKYHGDGVFALDCGANIGVFTLEWSRLMRGWGSVLAARNRKYWSIYRLWKTYSFSQHSFN